MHPDLAEYGPVSFHGDPNALYDRHLVFDYAIDPEFATPRERYEAVARSLRDVLALRWLRTRKAYDRGDVKWAYYFSMEFLIGRSLANNVTNLLTDPEVIRKSAGTQLDWYELLEQEPDAGLATAVWAASPPALWNPWPPCSFPAWATGSATSTASSGK